MILSLLLGFLAKTNGNTLLNWCAPFYSGGGYCSEAISFMQSMHEARLNFTISHHGDSVNNNFLNGLTSNEKSLLSTYLSTKVKFKNIITVCHSEPGAWYVPAPKYYTSMCPPTQSKAKTRQFNIGRTMFETNTIPSGWVDRLNYMDEIWVPTQFALDIFVNNGVNTNKVRVVEEPVDTNFFAPIVNPRTKMNEIKSFQSLKSISPSTFIFLFVGKFENRKGIDILLKAYFKEFTRADAVMLLFLTSAYHSSHEFDIEIQKILREQDLIFNHSDSDDNNSSVNNINHSESSGVGKNNISNNQQRQRHPPSYTILSGIEQEYMPLLYSYANILVIPSHGEGWGRPHMEAMSCGIPVIATNWSGPTAFMNSQNGYLLSIEDELIDAPGWKGHKWAQPSEIHLRQQMRHVYNHADNEVKVKGKQARQDMIRYYSLKVMGEKIKQEIERIEHVLEGRDDTIKIKSSKDKNHNMNDKIIYDNNNDKATFLANFKYSTFHKENRNEVNDESIESNNEEL